MNSDSESNDLLEHIKTLSILYNSKVAKAFQKARLLEDFRRLPTRYEEEIEIAIKSLDDLSIDDPYLDDFELDYVVNSELDYDSE